MGKFEDRLGDSISEAEERKLVSNELYAKYKQYVGALDALPQNEIDINRPGTDIHDQFGRIKPFSQWPTKSTRAKAQKIWTDYNTRIQQASQGGELSQEDPTADPDFLGQMLDTCVRTSMQMGKLDKNTAFRHCSRQVKRFENAIRGAMADRGLTSKQVEEFTKDLLRGMANGKNIDIKDLSVEDQQFIQDLRDSLTYRPKSEGVVRETYERVPMWMPEKEWNDFTSQIFDLTGQRRPGEVEVIAKPDAQEILKNIAKHDKTVRRVIAPDLKEDLEDTDRFGEECNYFNCDNRPDAERFHKAHTDAFNTVIQGPATGKFATMFEREMAKRGYYVVNVGPAPKWYHMGLKDQQTDWVFRESLEDADEFEKCEYGDCLQRNDPKFHEAHTEAAAAGDAAYLRNKLWPDFLEAFATIMQKYGYVKDAAGNWQKASLAEGEEPRPSPAIILPNMKSLKEGDWIELGSVAAAMGPAGSGTGLDDQDEFTLDDDIPPTPVEIVRITDIGKMGFTIGRGDLYRVALSNARLLSLPDKSGVRWHGRPKYHEPSWYQPWYKNVLSSDLEHWFEAGQLRVIDNIEQWFQAQPEK